MCRCRWMKNVNITPLRAVDGIFTAYSKTWRRSSGGDYLLKTLQVESHRVQKVQIIPLRKDGEMEYEV